MRTVWLPTVEGRPVHSREVWRFAGKTTEALALAPWQVTTLPLSWQTQFALLGACRDDRRLANGVVAGQDLLVWGELFRYAGALVARAAFLPALVTCDSQYESRWQPAFDGADRHRLFLLAARLPFAARCLDAPGLPAAAAPARTVAAAFVAETVDRLVRFASVTTLSRAHASKGRYASAHDAWLAALRGDGRALSVTVVVARESRFSIHRPEMCLPGQGFNIQSKRVRTLDLGHGRTVAANVMQVARAGEAPMGYLYWFVNARAETTSHWTRILSDTWAQAVHNRLNRWTMVTVFYPWEGDDPAAWSRLGRFVGAWYPAIVTPDATAGVKP